LLFGSLIYKKRGGGKALVRTSCRGEKKKKGKKERIKTGEKVRGR